MTQTKQKTYKRPTLIGNIRKMLVLPCAPIPSLWIATGADAALRAAWDVILPDPKETYHLLRGKSLVCDIKGGISDADIIPPPEDSSATRFFFSTLEWYDLATWYAFLADVADTGLINWTSNIIKFQCPNKEFDPNYACGNAYFGGLNINGTWQTADYLVNEGSRYGIGTDSSVVVRGGHSGSVAASASWIRAHADTEGGVAGRCIDQTLGVVYDTDVTPLGVTTTHLNHGFARIQNGENYERNIAQEWSFAGSQHSAGTAMICNGGTLSKYAEP